MPFVSRPLTTIMSSNSLPNHCDPQSPFLASLSSLSHSCVPTTAALTSAFFGASSVTIWIVVLVPQLLKHYRSKSVEGFTLLFLSLWIAGDTMALAGTFLTGQAAWQMLLAVYYLVVDSALLFQWFYYRRPRGNRVKAAPAPDHAHDDAEEFLLEDMDSNSDDESSSKAARSPLRSKPLPPLPPEAMAATAASSAEENPGHAVLHRRHSSGAHSTTFQNALLGAAMVQTAHAFATASTAGAGPTSLVQRAVTSTMLGAVLIWPPTILYIASRFPMLLRNHRRRSTAGLSPWFVAGTFSGNATYLAGLVTDPRAWADLPAFGGSGWVGIEGSQRWQWLRSVSPFIGGTAILAFLDLCIAVQFWHYRKNMVARS